MLQTADPIRYKSMLDVSKDYNKGYCNKWGYEYISYIGLKRGYHPWHAVYNRIYLFYELYNKYKNNLHLYEDLWIFYMDVDCVILDKNIPIEKFCYGSKSLILACEGGKNPKNFFYKFLEKEKLLQYNFNAGCFFFNLKHHFAKRFLKIWKFQYQIYSKKFLKKSINGWCNKINPLHTLKSLILHILHPQSKKNKYIMINDQDMIFYINIIWYFKYNFIRKQKKKFVTIFFNKEFNYDGKFICQILRQTEGNSSQKELKDRLSFIKNKINELKNN